MLRFISFSIVLSVLVTQSLAATASTNDQKKQASALVDKMTRYQTNYRIPMNSKTIAGTNTPVLLPHHDSDLNAKSSEDAPSLYEPKK